MHFDARLSASDVGWKVVAVSASDLGAMGATPRWMVLALSLPRADDDWVADFARGLGDAAAAFGVELVGGDTTRSPGPRVATITMGGPCPRPVRRSGARPGDDLWVTGAPGLAGAGWWLADPPADALVALRRPRPPVALGVALATSGLATSMMDLSDGLTSDLTRLARASGVAARVDVARLPAHPAVPTEHALRLAAGGGDDYALVFTADAGSAETVQTLAERLHERITRIGRIDAGSGVWFDGEPPPAPLFSHFDVGTGAP